MQAGYFYFGFRVEGRIFPFGYRLFRPRPIKVNQAKSSPIKVSKASERLIKAFPSSSGAKYL
jgi:hypothetical protein